MKMFLLIINIMNRENMRARVRKKRRKGNLIKM